MIVVDDDAMFESFEEFSGTLLYKEYLRLSRMLRMQVREFDDFGMHDINALDVIATPNSRYWVFRTKKSDDVLLMTNEEFQDFIKNYAGE